MLKLGDRVRHAQNREMTGEVVIVSKNGNYFQIKWDEGIKLDQLANGNVLAGWPPRHAGVSYTAQELIADPLQEVWDALEQKPILTKVNE